MKKVLSNDEMKNIFGGNYDYVQRRINNWDGGGAGGGFRSGDLARKAFWNLIQWGWSWFN